MKSHEMVEYLRDTNADFIGDGFGKEHVVQLLAKESNQIADYILKLKKKHKAATLRIKQLIESGGID